MSEETNTRLAQIGFSNSQPYQISSDSYALKQTPDGVDLWFASSQAKEFPDVGSQIDIFTLPAWTVLNIFSANMNTAGYTQTSKTFANGTPSPKRPPQELAQKVSQIETELINVLTFQTGEWGGVLRAGRVSLPTLGEDPGVVHLISSLNIEVWMTARVISHLYLDLKKEAQILLQRIPKEFPTLETYSEALSTL